MKHIILLFSFIFLVSCLGGEDTVLTEDSKSDAKVLSDVLNEEVLPDTGDISQNEVKTEITYKRECSSDSDCNSDEICISNICILKPQKESKVSNPKTEELTELSPDLSCIDENGKIVPPANEGPEKVTLYGIVDRFGGGYKTLKMKVTVFKMSDFDPSSCAGIDDYEKQKECVDKIIDSIKIGETLSFPADEAPDWMPEKKENPENCEDHPDCSIGYSCEEKDLEYFCEDQYGVYYIKGVPTNTYLGIRVLPTEKVKKWKSGYTYFAYLMADQAVKVDSSDIGYIYKYNPTIISSGEWVNIPNTMQTSIKEGKSAIGGRIRECPKNHDGEIWSWNISEATVGLGNPATTTCYFNEFENETLPVPERTSTNILGRFAFMDVAPGFNKITASALVDGKVKNCGYFEFFVVPDSLIIIAFPGVRGYSKK